MKSTTQGGYIALLLSVTIGLLMMVWAIKYYYLPAQNSVVGDKAEQESVIDYAQRTVDSAVSKQTTVP
ncbi:hypothetical protein KW782_03785 [Candidatus Parcubacteria bacterium]|nr:hypothetical protein [Candidatus Parcubacteria bacterium]